MVRHFTTHHILNKRNSIEYFKLRTKLLKEEMLWKERRPYISLIEGIPGDDKLLRMNKRTGKYGFTRKKYREPYDRLHYLSDDITMREISEFLVPSPPPSREFDEERGGKRGSRNTRKSK